MHQMDSARHVVGCRLIQNACGDVASAILSISSYQSVEDQLAQKPGGDGAASGRFEQGPVK